MQLLDNNKKETFMGSFPQVDPRYGKVLASRQVPREELRLHIERRTDLHHREIGDGYGEVRP
jgi:hypothetical protein